MLEWASEQPAKTPLDRLMRSLYPRGTSGRELVAIMTAYFDASGAPADQPFVVVSGLVANYLQWKVFEDAWAAIHQRFGISPLFT